MKRTNKQMRLLALAREFLIRSGESPSAADDVIGNITGDFRDLDNEDHQAAYEWVSTAIAGSDLDTI